MASDPLTWPRPRLRRPGPPSSSAGALDSASGGEVTPARMRIFPFMFDQTGTSRRSISAGPLIGPAILKDFIWYNSTHTTPLNSTFEVGKSPTSVREAGVALTTVRPYTVLTEFLDPFALISSLAGEGFPDATLPNTFVRGTIRLGLVVTDAEFFAVLSLVNNTANAQEVTGHLRVLEAVSLETLATYLGD